jgi:phage baseplate assembly protein W
MQLDFPYRIDTTRRTGETGADDHARDLIEQVLFTTPGERVNRPDFGCGLLRLTFEPNSPELAAATQLLVHGALQQWLADAIDVEDVTVEASDARLQVTVVYTLRRTRQRQTSVFTRGGVP